MLGAVARACIRDRGCRATNSRGTSHIATFREDKPDGGPTLEKGSEGQDCQGSAGGLDRARLQARCGRGAGLSISDSFSPRPPHIGFDLTHPETESATSPADSTSFYFQATRAGRPRSWGTITTASLPEPAFEVVVDTSALVAMLLCEPECHDFIALIAQARDPLISTATLLEASIVMQARKGDDRDLDALLTVLAIRPVAVDVAQAHVAREAFARFGKGRSAAALNFGDCFSYALARSMRRPLLYKGEGSARTDVQSAHAAP